MNDFGSAVFVLAFFEENGGQKIRVKTQTGITTHIPNL